MHRRIGEGKQACRAANGHHRQGRGRHQLRAPGQPGDGAAAGWCSTWWSEDGNPADSARCLPMLKRRVGRYGKPPSRAAFDGYASRGNLQEAKGLARHRACGVPQEARAEGGRHDAVLVAAPAAQELPGRRRGRHLLPEAVLRPGPLPLAAAWSASRPTSTRRCSPTT